MKLDGRALLDLAEVLAGLYPDNSDARMIGKSADMRIDLVRFDGKSRSTWFHLAERAMQEDKLATVVKLALADNPNHPFLVGVLSDRPTAILRGPEVPPDQWKGLRGSALEKIIGAQSSLVPISFLEMGAVRARAVVRVAIGSGWGTGFIVRDGRGWDLLITNNHVIQSLSEASEAQVEFNYQLSLSGEFGPLEKCRLDPTVFFATSARDDWTAVAVAGTPSERWGALKLGRKHIRVGEHVNIIQHPSGGPKQMSFLFNSVVYVGGDRVQYLRARTRTSQSHVGAQC